MDFFFNLFLDRKENDTVEKETETEIETALQNKPCTNKIISSRSSNNKTKNKRSAKNKTKYNKRHKKNEVVKMDYFY